MPRNEKAGNESAGSEPVSDWPALAEVTGAAYLRYSFTKGTDQEVAFLLEALGLRAGQRILDAGCGPGRHSRALAAHGLHVVGLDVAPRFLELAVAGGGPARFVRADVRRPPLRPASF